MHGIGHEAADRSRTANGHQRPMPNIAAANSKRGCEWSRSLVLHTSGESELLQTEQPANAKINIKPISFFMIPSVAPAMPPFYSRAGLNVLRLTYPWAPAGCSGH
jgi:hypothetical protein